MACPYERFKSGDITEADIKVLVTLAKNKFAEKYNEPPEYPNVINFQRSSWPTDSNPYLKKFERKLKEGSYTHRIVFKKLEKLANKMTYPSSLCNVYNFVYSYFTTLNNTGDRSFEDCSLYNSVWKEYEIERYELKRSKEYMTHIVKLNKISPQLCGSFFEACCAYVLGAEYDSTEDISLIKNRTELYNFFNSELFTGNLSLIKIQQNYNSKDIWKYGVFGMLLGRACMHYFSHSSNEDATTMGDCREFIDYYEKKLQKDFIHFMKSLTKDLSGVYGENQKFTANRKFTNKNLKGVCDIISNEHIIDCKVCKNSKNNSELHRKWFYQIDIYKHMSGLPLLTHSIIDLYNFVVLVYNVK